MTKPRPGKPPDLADQLREAIQESGLSLNGLARVCGVHQAQLSRFLRGERTLQLTAAARLCEHLGLHLNAAAPAASGPPGLFPKSVYAIAARARLDQIHKTGGAETLVENRRWTRAESLLVDARRRGQPMPVLFADAAYDVSRVIYWAILKDITVAGKTTEYRFEGLRPLPKARPTQQLILQSTGQPIAPGFRRSYAICRTPRFLSEEK